MFRIQVKQVIKFRLFGWLFSHWMMCSIFVICWSKFGIPYVCIESQGTAPSTCRTHSISAKLQKQLLFVTIFVLRKHLISNFNLLQCIATHTHRGEGTRTKDVAAEERSRRQNQSTLGTASWGPAAPKDMPCTPLRRPDSCGLGSVSHLH